MKTLLITVMTLLFHPVLQAQTCIQPGSLVSIFNTKKGNYEYLVFKFVAPYNSKGVLTQGPSNLFSSDNRAGKTYHRISFSDIKIGRASCRERV